MTYNKTLKLALLLAIISTTFTATPNLINLALADQGPPVCPQRCEDCLYNSQTNKYDCDSCLGAYYINKNQCSTTAAPASENCISYILDQCLTCAAGYVLQRLTKPVNEKNWVCKPSLIPSCMGGQVQTNPGDTHTPQNENCFVCVGGYPSKDLKHCYVWSKIGGKDARIPQILGCIWGLRAWPNAHTWCYRCEKGLAFREKFATCEKPLVEGCFRYKETGCVSCDAFAGYYSDQPGSCKKI